DADRPGGALVRGLLRPDAVAASRRPRPVHRSAWGQGVILLGLTGSIGMGKSTTAAIFRELGVPVYDADAEVHASYAPGGACVGPVEEAFPGVVKNGAIDREALRKRVLGKPEELKRLNSVVHPIIGALRRTFFHDAEAAGADLVVLDIPLLLEGGGERGM